MTYLILPFHVYAWKSVVQSSNDLAAAENSLATLEVRHAVLRAFTEAASYASSFVSP